MNPEAYLSHLIFSFDYNFLSALFQALRHSREPSVTWCFMCWSPAPSRQVTLCLASNELAQCWHPDRLGGETLFLFRWFLRFHCSICSMSMSGVGQVPVFYMFLFVCQKVRVKVVACACRLLIVVHCCCWTVVGCCCILPGLVVCGCLYAAPWDDPHLVKLIH